MDELEKWKKEHELQDRTIDIILSSFTKPIKHDYTIPEHVSSYLAKALKEICKEGEFSSDYYGTHFLPKDSNLLEERVLSGIRQAFSCGKEEHSYFDHELTMNNDMFGDEWFYGIATLYRYRKGERKKAKERANAFWKKEEKDDFNKITGIMKRLLAEKLKKKN